jgi:hypothetical protein
MKVENRSELLGLTVFKENTLLTTQADIPTILQV